MKEPKYQNFIYLNCWFIVDSTQYMRYLDLPSLMGGNFTKLRIESGPAYASSLQTLIVQLLCRLSHGRPLRFGQTVKIYLFDNNISSTLINTGLTTPKFEIKSGILQGCLLFPYLFIIVAKILAIFKYPYLWKFVCLCDRYANLHGTL